MSRNLRYTLGLVAATIVVLVVIANLGGGTAKAPAPDAGETTLVRSDSQRLSVADDGRVTFVEFLDFECEACRAAHPAVEQLRERYEGEVTFVVRNFPLHNNSMAAARAAEAAAAQGKYVDMYTRLFETQPEWGEKDSPQETVFFGFAEELNLDMDQFRSDYDDPATIAKIERDQADGRSLGVEGTPTFFLNGDKIEPTSLEDLIAQIDAALAE